MKSVLLVIGIILNTLGTLLTLWTIFSTKDSFIGTAAEYDSRHERFPTEKQKVIKGFVFIVLGNCLQILSIYVN